MDVILETERLLLRRFSTDDAANLFELDSDPEVMRYLSKGKPTPMEDIIEKFLSRIFDYYRKFDNLGFWALMEKSTEEFIGWFHLKPDRNNPEDLDLGYRLKRSVWNKGYATEMARALIDMVFDELDFQKVTAHTVEYNHASRRVMEKAGMKLENHFIYEQFIFPDWSEDERRAVKYAIYKKKR